MADNLDDFFAKRDKKKPKGKKKFETAEDLTKVLENKAKERKQLETQRSTYVAPPTESGEPAPALSEYKQQVENEDDEWKEMEEQRPDYSNLKIQELHLTDEEDEFGEKDSELKEDGTTEGSGSVWSGKPKFKEEPEAPKEAPEEEKKTEDEAASEESKDTEPKSLESNPSSAPATEQPKTGGYVPPAKRAQMQAEQGKGPGSLAPPLVSSSSESPAPGASAAGKYVPPSKRFGAAGPSAAAAVKKKQVPLSLDSEELFPSLGS